MGHFPKDADVSWISSAGTVIPADNAPVTLAAGTYYADLGGSEGTASSLFLSWDGTIVASATIESTNLPSSQASVFAAAGNLWFPEAPAAVAIAAGSPACNTQHLGFSGARRLRVKLVVTTQGAIRGRAHHKD